MKPVDNAKQITTRHRSRYTELHWIPRPSGRGAGALQQDFAPIGRDLGIRDWASIDPLRVRTSKGVRHGSTPAMYFWQRTSSHVWCESQEERWAVLWLDYGGQVAQLWAQPMAIGFGHGSRLMEHWHIPDLLAQFTDGSYGLIDVRPAERIDDLAELQFAETANVCEKLGWHYQVVDGYDRRATRNLNCLSASRHQRCAPEPHVEAQILQAARNGRTRGDLCEIVSPACPPIACAWVDNLAWRRLLAVDLSSVFSSSTVYTTSRDSDGGSDQ